MHELQEILATLVGLPSVTPKDAGCQLFMINYLKKLGFDCQAFDNPPVNNLFARLGNKPPLLLFAGHTDVVATGEKDQWLTDPFILHQQGDWLYGRGTADMKGSLAAMLIMAKELAANKLLKGSVGFLITSGEEGQDFNAGTPHVMEQLKNLGIYPNYCIVGEPSSHQTLADTIRIGRRGSLTANLTLLGKQGHVAYPHLASNPIHCISQALAELTKMVWDEGNAFFPPTSLQLTHIQSGGHGNNIIPGALTLQANFRFSPENTIGSLQQQFGQIFDKYGLKPTIDWQISGQPFLTSKGILLQAVVKAIQSQTNQTPILSTGGGTSDGRFIAPYGVEVIELGPINATIHQVNERVSLTDLLKLKDLYSTIAQIILS